MNGYYRLQYNNYTLTITINKYYVVMKKFQDVVATKSVVATRYKHQ